MWQIHYVMLTAALQTPDYFTNLMLFHKVTQSEGELRYREIKYRICQLLFEEGGN